VRPAFFRPTLFFFISVSTSASLKTIAQQALLLLLLTTSLAFAQRKKRDAPAANADGSLAATAPTPARPARLQPLFGNLTATEATKLFGAKQLDAIAASFASREEASTFFAQKGFEYLTEHQPDTAVYRFNLAWLLNPTNVEVYRGLGVIASTQPTPDAAIALLNKGLALAPTNAQLIADLGTSYLNRYALTKKKKDLSTGVELLQRATAADARNGIAWHQLAQGYYDQENYPAAWEALHKGQALDMANLDFNLVTQLLTKQPDPQGMFK
jgi:tetratricopeptide (TPR) repeat protein